MKRSLILRCLGLSLVLQMACSDDTKSRPDAAVDLRTEGGVSEAGADLGPAPDAEKDFKPGPDKPRPSKEAGGDLPQLPGNSACLKAEPVTLTGGKAQIKGTTVGLVNEFGGVKCGSDLITPLTGPQGYYSLTIGAGKTYRIAVTAAFTGASFYFFSSAAGCTAAGIEKDCQSGGATGFKLPSLTTNVKKEIYFSNKTGGTFLFAVDGATGSASGTFTVDIEEYSTPSNSTCAAAQNITLTGGKAVIQGNTYGAADEFTGQLKCGGYTAFNGPQVYYRMYVGAGKSYKFKLTPTFNAYLYIFSDSAGCSPGPINQYCASGGATGDKMGSISAGTSKALVFSPFPPAGYYIIAVDSQDLSNAGSFVLEVEDFTPATNGTCSKAQPITLSGGKATVAGSTLGIKDEFSTLKCGGYSNLSGPQAYYTLSMTAGKTYRIGFTPSGFSAYLYVFASSAGCTQSGIEAACSSKGASGDKWGSYASPASAYFTPGQTGTYYLAVDSTSSSYQGDFTLDIQELSPPTNGTCATAAPITLVGGKATVNGATVGTKDEFSTLKCGGYTAFSGPQVYYSIVMSQGKLYNFTITPLSFTAYMYLFTSGAGCNLTNIENNCSSKGATGDKWGPFYSKGTGFFVPSSSGTYILGIDSSYATSQGEFTLEVVETLPPTNTTCATAELITVVPGTPTTVNGTTIGAKDEFSTLKCGGYSSFVGPQVYYKADMKAGVSYNITLNPTFTAYLYVFPSSANCTQSAIETACASKGASDGDKWGPYYSSASYTFIPATSGMHVIAIDSTSTSYAGAFTLTVE